MFLDFRLSLENVMLSHLKMYSFLANTPSYLLSCRCALLTVLSPFSSLPTTKILHRSDHPFFFDISQMLFGPCVQLSLFKIFLVLLSNRRTPAASPSLSTDELKLFTACILQAFPHMLNTTYLIITALDPLSSF